MSLLALALMIAVAIVNKTRKFNDNGKIENDLIDVNEIINQNIESLI